MSITVNPTIPVIAAQGVAPDLVLQPGTVVDAQVLKLLSDNLVRIAISNLAIDVLTEVPLQAGQNLQLAVSQTPDGIRLAVVGPDAAASSSGTSADTVTLAPDAPINAVANSAPSAAPSGNVLTPLQRAAVSAAAANAATQQDSLAPLFANLGAAAASNSLPPKLQQAVLQVLAQRTSFDPSLTGSDVKNAFQKSGLFLEASLASGSVPPQAGVPDLKAALIVLRQTLLSSLGSSDSPAASATVAQQPVSTAVGTSAADIASPPHAPATTSTPSPSLSPEIEVQEILLLPQARVPVDDSLGSQNPLRIVLPQTLLNAWSRTMTAGTVLNLLQETLQGNPLVGGGNTSPATATLQARWNDDVTVHTNTPPPPVRGALPSPQPIAAPSIASNTPLAASAHHLLSDTDAAIARQTLLQVASLPDRIDTTGARTDPATPRWNFEIPFVTPQGTAMAQFEISRDGGGNEAEGTKRVWRARFSPDAPPARPGHALVSFCGGPTPVGMWCEPASDAGAM